MMAEARLMSEEETMSLEDQIRAKQILFDNTNIVWLLKELLSYVSLYDNWIEQITIVRNNGEYVAYVWERLDEDGY